MNAIIIMNTPKYCQDSINSSVIARYISILGRVNPVRLICFVCVAIVKDLEIVNNI